MSITTADDVLLAVVGNSGDALVTSAQVFEVLGFILVVAGVISSILVVKLTKARAEEWKAIAEVRGVQLDDLREELVALRSEVAELRGGMLQLQNLKAEEIAERVAELMLHVKNGGSHS